MKLPEKKKKKKNTSQNFLPKKSLNREFQTPKKAFAPPRHIQPGVPPPPCLGGDGHVQDLHDRD